MTISEIILDHLHTLRGDGRTLDELVHELTVLRRTGREMPPPAPDVVLWSLEHLEEKRKVRRDGDQWFYATVDGPKQGRLFS